MPSISFSSLFSIVCLWLLYLQCSRAAEINEAIAPYQEPGQSPKISKLLRRSSPSTPDYLCDTDRPCTDSSCCNIVTKTCGRDPTHCAVNVCISNCDARAECGIGAADPSASCPLNVCCSQFGYCGIGDDFCGTGCQSNCEQPGAINSGVGDVQKLVIGYWEGWCLNSRSCNARTINDVPVDSLTHLNLAFAYITSDFNITPMPGTGDMFTIWISIGGWTFNDNGTSTQPLFSEIASTETNRGIFATNLFTFCNTWGFDGVDLDWEYPGAGDRGGTPADTPNYTKLLEQISAVFASADLGLSFTAPTSYWYLQHFDIGHMYQYVNWINLMTYDLHGSWDSPADYIGSYVFGHTNLTEIDLALNLFWRNDVPANKINLGLGFYGRSFTLDSLNCIDPGCPFTGPSVAGECTGQGGILSYAEIMAMQQSYNLVSVYDSVAAVKYIAWNQNQWVSYDDQETFQQKILYANSLGLNGLFIWAIDLDTTDHQALAAVLGGKLGAFSSQNGVNSNSGDFIPIPGNGCTWSACGNACGTGLYNAGATEYCGPGFDGGPSLTQTLCCPLGAVPDPQTCTWWVGNQGLLGLSCSGSCQSDEVSVATSTDPYVNGQHLSCFSGFAEYCCKGTFPISNVCSWTSSCEDIISSGNGANVVPNYQPSDPTVCGSRKPVTSRLDNCKNGQAKIYCCDTDIATGFCYWNEGTAQDDSTCVNSDHCRDQTDTLVVQDYNGGFDITANYHTCSVLGSVPYTRGGQRSITKALLAFCCPADVTGTTIQALPVALEDLFPTPGPSTDTQKYEIEIDSSTGSASPNNVDPNASGFGFYIISGVKAVLQSLNKRDNSHWELFDCNNSIGEQRQTVKAVCTDDSENSNCGDIFIDGAPETIIEMPGNCGPGKYAVVVSMEVSTDHMHLENRLFRRGLGGAAVYDLTFDYDFTPIQKRDDSSVLLRIDYSDDPGYWASIVAAQPGTKHKRDIDIEVEQQYGGDHKAWLADQWHIDKRSLPLEELHKRWWSGDLREWLDRQKQVDITYTGIRHSIQNTYDIPIFMEDLNCPILGTQAFDELYMKMWVDLNVNVQASAGITLIGNLGDLTSWDESHAWFRTSGHIDANLNFQAKGHLSFHTGPVEVFGLQNFGGTFRAPGVVTIGPNFRFIADVSGDADLEVNAQYHVSLADWDYNMQYPAADIASQEPSPMTEASVPGIGESHDPFSWDFAASGSINVHIKPQIEFGIKFDSNAIADASLNIGVDAYANVYGKFWAGSTTSLGYCYGMDGSTTLFAQVEAPKIFNTDLSSYWPLQNWPYVIIPETCGP